MAKDCRIYDVFISSPSDVSSERDIVEEAIELVNQLRGLQDGFRLAPIRWERDVSSQIGGQPQEIINEQVGDEYDIFVGILCNRFGQKTQNFESGTEEEFNRALDRHNNSEQGPEILFYFKDPRRSEDPIDAEQFIKVSQFKKSISSLGVYGEFETQENLKTILVTGLSKAIDRLILREDEKAQCQNHSSQEMSLSSSGQNDLVSVDEFDDDIGLFDLTDIVLDSTENFTDRLSTISDATKRLGDKISARTDDINNIKPTGDARADQKSAKLVIEKVASDMQRYSHIVDQATPDLRHEFSLMQRGLQHVVLISHQDGMSSTGDVRALVDTLVAMKQSLTTVHGQVSKFRDAVSATPRMTSKLNQAKRRTVQSVNDVLDFIAEASVSVDATLGAIQS